MKKEGSFPERGWAEENRYCTSLELYLGYIVHTQSKTKGVGLPCVGGYGQEWLQGGRGASDVRYLIKIVVVCTYVCEVTCGGGRPEKAKLTVIFGQNIFGFFKIYFFIYPIDVIDVYAGVQSNCTYCLNRYGRIVVWSKLDNYVRIIALGLKMGYITAIRHDSLYLLYPL